MDAKQKKQFLIEKWQKYENDFKAKRAKLADRIRIKLHDEKGNEIQIDETFLDESVWLRITDMKMLKQVFAVHDVEPSTLKKYFCAIKKDSKKLLNIEEFKAKKEELKEKYEQEIKDLLYTNKKLSISVIDSLNYFQFLDFIKENNLEELKQKKELKEKEKKEKTIAKQEAK